MTFKNILVIVVTILCGDSLRSGSCLKFSDLRVQRNEVWHENCSFPDYPLFHRLVAPYLRIKPDPNCPARYPRYTYIRDNALQFDLDRLRQDNMNALRLDCCYREYSRGNKNDDDIRVSQCTYFTPGARRIPFKPTVEYIKLECRSPENYYNYHALGALNSRDDAYVRMRQAQHGLTRNNAYSIIMVASDAVSKLNSKRGYNQSRNLLLGHYGAVEMKAFNKVGLNTWPNFNGILYGDREHPCTGKTPTPECTWVWNYARDIGYRTLFSEDTPYATFNFFANGGFARNEDIPFSSYFRSLIRHVEIRERNRTAFGSPVNRCYGPRTIASFLLEFQEDFIEYYREDPLFLLTWVNEPQHYDPNSLNTMDHSYAVHLRDLLRDPLNVRRSFIFFFGDHGYRFSKYHETYEMYWEDRNPMMIIYVPEDFRAEFPEKWAAIQKNSDRLTTPMDIYATLRDILTSATSPVTGERVPLGGPAGGRAGGRTLFEELNPERDCNEARVPSDGNNEKHWCACHYFETVPNRQLVPPETRNLRNGHREAVRLLNEKISSVADECLPYTVSNTKIADYGWFISKLYLEYAFANFAYNDRPIHPSGSSYPLQMLELILILEANDFNGVRFEIGIRVYENCPDSSDVVCDAEPWGPIVPLYTRSERDRNCVASDLALYCLCK